MPGEVFGEADVILRGRLDLLQRDLDEAEMMVVQQQQRVVQAQQQAAARIYRSGQEAQSAVNLIGGVDDAVGQWYLLDDAVNGVRLSLRAIPAVALAAKAALVAAAVAAVLAYGLLVDQFRQGVRGIRSMAEAYREMDGSTGRAREFAEALEKIPLAGRAASFAFRVFGGDAILADEALTNMVATVEDGEVKVGILGRAVNGLVYAATLGFVDIVGDIEEANEAMRKFNSEMAIASSYHSFGGPQGERTDAFVVSASREAELAGLQGIQRIRVENRIRHEEAMAYFDGEMAQANDHHAMVMRHIKERQDAGEIEEAQARRERMIGTNQNVQRLADLEDKRAEASKHLTSLARQRIRVHIQEEQAIRHAARAETRRMDTLARAMEMRAAGNTLGADLVEIEQRKQDAITRALEDGQRQRVSIIRRHFDALAIMTRDAHQADIDAERDQQRQKQMLMMQAQQREALQRGDSIAGLRAQVEATRLRTSGQDFEAQRVMIEEEMRQRIEEAIRAGDREMLEVLQDLRRTRLRQVDQLEREQKLREAEQADRDRLNASRSDVEATARQIDTARERLGGFGDPKREEKQMVEQQKKTNRLLKQNGGARAG